jgi:hypothetical protein
LSIANGKHEDSAEQNGDTEKATAKEEKETDEKNALDEVKADADEPGKISKVRSM